MVQTQRKSFTWGWVVLGVALLGHGMVMGFVAYAMPVIFGTMVTANGWNRGDASAALSIGSWVGLGAYPLAGWALKRWGGRKVVSVGAIALGITWILLSQVTELWHWLALRGLVWAVVGPLASTAAFTTIIVQWFNLRRGIAIGTVFIGYSVFGFTSAPVAQLVMQSTKSWQAAWAALGVVLVITGVVCALFIRSKPADVGLYPDGLDPEEAKRARAATMAGQASGHRAIARTYRSPINWTAPQAMRTRQFWLLVLTMGAFAGGSFSSSQMMFIAPARGYSAAEAAFAISLPALAATPWRFITGWLTDRIEARWCLMVGYVIAGIALVLLWTLPSGNVLWLYAYAICLGTGMAGMGNTIMSVITSNYYGPGNFPTIFTWLTPIAGSIGALGPIASGYIYDWTKTYDLAFVLFIGLIVIAMVGQFFNPPPRVKQPEVAQPATAA